MKTVLVTGAGGFIGRHCLPRLSARGYEVHAVSRRAGCGSPDGVQWHRTDLLDAVATARLVAEVRASHLLHLAWYVVPGSFYASEQNYAWVRASLELVQRFISAGGRRVVVAGSSQEYDLTFGYCSETRTPVAPSTVYSACKHALHVMLQGMRRENAISLAWARIFFLYGRHEHPARLVPSVIRSLLADRPAECTHGEQVRDYLYVEDAADALVAIVDSDLEGPINIASGVPLAVGEIVRTIARILGREYLLRMGAIPLRGDETPFVVGNPERLRRELFWKPRYGLQEGLERTIAWWEAQCCLGQHLKG